LCRQKVWWAARAVFAVLSLTPLSAGNPAAATVRVKAPRSHCIGSDIVRSTEHPANPDNSFSEFAISFAENAKALFAAGDVQSTLAIVVELAVATIDGCDFAGLFLIEGDTVSTPTYTDPIVVEIDALQHSTGEGPCLDAIAHRLIFYADDLTRDLRWLHFGPKASKAGIRSVLALPLSADAQFGALNLYALYPVAFGVVDRARAAILASMASLALSVAHSHEDEARRAENLHAALASRETIGEATGILMERERITAAQAFDILRRASQHLNIKLRQVAEDLIETGVQPDTGSTGSDLQSSGAVADNEGGVMAFPPDRSARSSRSGRSPAHAAIVQGDVIAPAVASSPPADIGREK
jgi:GAF domain-containing protein